MNKALIALALSSLFAPLAKAQLPSQSFSGNADAARASGVWESHEGVSIFCGRMTSLDAIVRGESQAVCFVTEVQALGKDLPSVSTNTYIVQTWDKHHLVAETSFYADKDGNETPALNTSTRFIFRIVVDFDARSVSAHSLSASMWTMATIGETCSGPGMPPNFASASICTEGL